MKRCSFCPVLLLTCVSSFHAAGQQMLQDDVFSMSMEALLDVTVSVSNKLDTKLNVSPASVSLFSRQDINNLGVRHLMELLQHVPGFYPVFSPVEGNQSYLITRGHAQKYANTVLFLLNGQRINEDYTGGINYLIRHFNLSQVERVEVIRGTGSALYGANAFNGVVNIITGEDDFLSVSGGSHQMIASEFSIQGEKGAFKWGVGGSYYRDKGEQYSDIFDRLGLQSTTQDPHDNQQLSLSLAYKNFNWHSLLQRSSFEDYYLFRRVSDQHNKMQLENWVHQLGYELWKNNDEEVMFSAQLQQGERSSLAMLANQDDQDFQSGDFLFGEQFSAQSLQLGLEGNKRLREDWLITAGFEWNRSQLPDGFVRSNYNLYGDLEWLGKVTVFDQVEQRIVLDKTRTIRSVFVQTQHALSEQLNLTAGFRWDGYNDVANKLNPRLALVYQPATQHVLKAIYGEAYRVPSLGDLYDEESGLTQGNTSLNPSTIQSYELAYQYTHSNFFVGTTLFHNDIEDLIGFDSGDTVALANIAQNEATGVEIEWRWNVTERLWVRGHGTHLFNNESEVKNQASLTPSEQLSPKTYAMTVLDYQISDHWQGQLQWSYRDAIEVTDDHNSLSLFSGLIHYRPSKTHSWQLRFTNLFDREYKTPVIQQIGTLDGKEINELPSRGRGVSVKYTWRF